MPENIASLRKVSDNAPNHKLTLIGRRQMSVSGVKEVLSFDTSSVEMLTEQGELIVDGEGMRMGTLDTKDGIVELEGNITALTYSSPDGERRVKRNPFKRFIQ